MRTHTHAHSQACTWFHRHIPMDTQIHSLFTDIPTCMHRIAHMSYAWLNTHTHSQSHTHIYNDTLTWMYMVTQTYSKVHTQFYIHTILHTYAQLYRHTSMHIHGDTRLYTHTHSHAHTLTGKHTPLPLWVWSQAADTQYYTTAPVSRCPCSVCCPQMSPAWWVEWIPLSISPNTVFLWLLLHYSSPCHHAKEARLWQRDRGQSPCASTPWCPGS